MNRLTNKKVLDEMSKFPKDYTFSSEELIYNKLGQYEDVDEELGIDYITFNKLRKANKIYYLNDNNEIMEVEVYSIDLINCCLSAMIISPYINVWSFKEYGKTWALTREELEMNNRLTKKELEMNNRLTRKGEDGKYHGRLQPLTIYECLPKLGKYEDIEEELNTNFIILGRAKQNGIYRILNDEVKYISPSEMTVYIDHIMLESGKQLYLYEYGESWALTKEVLYNVKEN